MKIRQRPLAGCSEVEKFSGQTEEEADLHDALSPHHDQLDLAPFWWILEYLSLQRKYQTVSLDELSPVFSFSHSLKQGDGSWKMFQKFVTALLTLVFMMFIFCIGGTGVVHDTSQLSR
jgi:hypothetical protein